MLEMQRGAASGSARHPKRIREGLAGLVSIAVENGVPGAVSVGPLPGNDVRVPNEVGGVVGGPKSAGREQGEAMTGEFHESIVTGNRRTNSPILALTWEL